MRALMLALVLSCKSGSAGAPAEEQPLRAPEPWTLGVGRERALALPPPCRLRSEMLRTVLARDTRFESERSQLGVLIAAEVSRVPEERIDAAGAVSMILGRSTFTAVPWPTRGKPRVARDEGGAWWVAYARDGGAFLWHGGRGERLDVKLEPVDLRCHGGRCALLGSTPAEGLLLVGATDEALQAWEHAALPAGARVERIASLEPQGTSWKARVVALADGRLGLFEIEAAKSAQRVRELPAPYGVLDAVVARGALWAAMPTGSPGCNAEVGGLTIVWPGGQTRLRSGLPAARASLSPVAGGMLVVWLAPVDCESGRMQLYASAIREDGTPVGPVTAVAVANDYAVASRDESFDLWVEHDRILSWAPTRCALAH